MKEVVKTEPIRPEQWTYKGKPLRILSTSLGLILAANMLLAGSVYSDASPTPNLASDQPKLVEYSSEQVKKYYNANDDWNIPIPADLQSTSGSQATPAPNSNGQTSGGNTTIINNNNGGGFGGGFGWTDLLLYHMMFNSGSSYSSSHWYSQRTVFVPGTSRPYQPKSFTSDTFQNRPTTGSTVRPVTSQKSGTFNTKSSTSTKSSSSSKGGIGSTSSGFGSSSKSSGSSFGG